MADIMSRLLAIFLLVPIFMPGVGQLILLVGSWQLIFVLMGVQAYADRIVIRQDGVIVGEHVRCFGRGETIYDPWHYVPVLTRKPGALRNGATFQDWALPSGRSTSHVGASPRPSATAAP